MLLREQIWQVNLRATETPQETSAGYSSVSGTDKEVLTLWRRRWNCVNGAVDQHKAVPFSFSALESQGRFSSTDCLRSSIVLSQCITNRWSLMQSLQSGISISFSLPLSHKHWNKSKLCFLVPVKHCRATQLSCGSESQICPSEGKLIYIILLYFSEALMGTVAVTT